MVSGDSRASLQGLGLEMVADFFFFSFCLLWYLLAGLFEERQLADDLECFPCMLVAFMSA